MDSPWPTVALLAFFIVGAICFTVIRVTQMRAESTLDIEKERTEQKRLELETEKIKAGVDDTTTA